jgi:hypothetical protein
MRAAIILAFQGFWLTGCQGCKPEPDAVTSTTPPPATGTVKIGGHTRGADLPGDDKALAPAEGTIAFHAQPAVPGDVTSAHLRVSAGPGYEINERFVWKLALAPTPGVTLPKTSFRGGGRHAQGDAAAFDHRELAIDIPLTVERAGRYAIRGNLDFAVCKRDQVCLAKSVPVTVQVAAR